MSEIVATNQTILVVGGGISGMTAALEAAEVGKQVIVVEKRPFIGGRVSQLYKLKPGIAGLFFVSSNQGDTKIVR